MNTSKLKNFARAARQKLIEQVSARLDYILTTDTAELREKAAPIKALKDELNRAGREALVEKVAYTWFNRLMALRYMDVNDYQPLDLRVLSPKEGYTTPELLDEAKRGHIPDELRVDARRINDLLDGRLPSANPQNEAYRILLVAACNYLHTVLPFLFERLSDYTELLLPDDLTSEFSIVHDVREGMAPDDCTQVEVIGWLYQFYISEENERLISSKKSYKKSELAPASQLFTPKWIVQYMVDNTLGQLWTEVNPRTTLTTHLEFYIKPENIDSLPAREKKSIEEITFFDPCVGSAHILSYAFDVFYKIYEEQGYNPGDITELILTKNLYGVDIDERAAQLAYFVLMMKGRQYYRRFFKKSIVPNIAYYQDFPHDEKFKNASAIGSLIQVEPEEINKIQVDEGSLFGENQKQLKQLYSFLGQRYDLVVTNPPYISSSRMEGTLKQYVEAKYPATKSDLFATFILRCLELCNEGGLTGYMTPFVWMFISSYEKLREEIIDNHFINNLIQLEYSGFDGATVPICTLTLRNAHLRDVKGSYIRLADFKGPKLQAPKTIEALQDPNCSWFYTANQKDFEKIPGSPIAYWLPKSMIDEFKQSPQLNSLSTPRSGLSTSDSPRFLRIWHETANDRLGLDFESSSDASESKRKWFPMMKGGGYRKWYGNHEYVVNYYNNGEEVKYWLVNNPNDPSTNSWSRYVRSPKYYFKKGLTWSGISSSKPSMRIMKSGLFGSGGKGLFSSNVEYILGFLNSKISLEYLKVFSPTLNFEVGHINKLPLSLKKDTSVEDIVNSCIEFSQTEWDKNETSWDFQQNELLRIKKQDDIPLEETYDLYQQYWRNKFFQLHRHEEELNRQFIDIYGLQDELTPEVPLEEITILKDETSIQKGELVFKAEEVMAQFVSYAVGCMFGRYALDAPGLILANQGETLQDYLRRVPTPRFRPDAENIIPILDDEWFEDDIVGRFHAFLKASFGAAHFNKNLAFLEAALGKDLRKYFIKDFYPDHISRYKKRPIYWLFSSPQGSFNVLIYLHRYTPDTLSQILNKYLREYQARLHTRQEHLDRVEISGTAAEKTRAAKEKAQLAKVLLELQEYEREILYPLAAERIALDLDDGVLVNYNKLGRALKPVKGLNDAKTKKKVRGFDWVEAGEVR